MARIPTPELVKLKERIIELPEAEAKALYEWLTCVLEVREADRRAEGRRNGKAPRRTHESLDPA
ncbi:MAG TPA: hypothetical protein VIY07_09540 [Pseudolabrys sp.]